MDQRTEPQPAADELSTLTQFLDYHRATLLGKVDGLSDEQLRQRIPSSELTLAGLVKHLALVEDQWFQEVFLGRSQEPWSSAPWDTDRDWEMHSALTDPGEELRALYRAACERSRAVTAASYLDQLAARPTKAGEVHNLRWILVHLIEETARHNGHADLLREAVDGATGE